MNRMWMHSVLDVRHGRLSEPEFWAEIAEFRRADRLRSRAFRDFKAALALLDNLEAP